MHLAGAKCTLAAATCLVSFVSNCIMSLTVAAALTAGRKQSFRQNYFTSRPTMLQLQARM